MTALPLSDWTERRYISRYATDPLGLQVYSNGVLTDVDANLMTVAMETSSITPPGGVPSTPLPVFSRTADRLDVGTYQTNLQSAETSAPGAYDVIWTYTINGTPEAYTTFIEVGDAQPAYDMLPPEFKQIVDNVWMRFADAFDSVYGGPNLQDYFQSHFGRGRIAQLMGVAMRRMSVRINPPLPTPWTTGPTNVYPTNQWGALLESATYIESIKHLMRSYVEQPNALGVGVARLDRSDYTNKWGSILETEMREFEDTFSIMRISFMNLGRPAVLVSGGVFGVYAPTRIAGSAAARPHYWARWY